MSERIYKIDDGITFEGTLEQFQDCFFSNADHELIVNWCKNVLEPLGHKSDVEWSDDEGKTWVSPE